jgi:hypothetical protein
VKLKLGVAIFLLLASSCARETSGAGPQGSSTPLQYPSAIAPGATVKQDAIAVNLDHRGDYSVVVMFPYVFSSSGELVVSAPFASPGARAIFPE